MIIFLDMIDIFLVAISEAVSQKCSCKRVVPKRFATKFTRKLVPVADLLFSENFVNFIKKRFLHK